MAYVLNDYDFVEEQNLYRQNFIRSDMGKNKADVLAIRYGSHFGIDIRSCSEKLEVARPAKLFLVQRNDGIHWSPKYLCLNSAVDNNKARKVMHDSFQTWDGFGYGHPLIYIVAGNGKFTGQVVIRLSD